MGAKDQGANATKGRYLAIPRTLCFVLNGDSILLMKRASHRRVFPNKYNGLGGHIERDEDPLSGARREIYEESGLTVQSLRLRSIHNIDAGQQEGICLFVYTAESNTREVHHNSDEGTLEWIPIDRLADYDLVEDLPYILPRILQLDENSAPLSLHVCYDDNDEIQVRFAQD